MLLLALVASAALSSDPDSAYGNSVSYPLYAEACASSFPEHSDEYLAALESWIQLNKAQIEKGRANADELGAGEGSPGYPMVLQALKSGVTSFSAKPLFR